MSAARLFFPDMTDNFANHQAAGDFAEGAAVAAVGVQANHKNGSAAIFQPLNNLDPFALARMKVNDHIPGLKTRKKDGDFGYNHKIPILVSRV
jgi:hypothetical protein